MQSNSPQYSNPYESAKPRPVPVPSPRPIPAPMPQQVPHPAPMAAPQHGAHPAPTAPVGHPVSQPNMPMQAAPQYAPMAPASSYPGAAASQSYAAMQPAIEADNREGGDKILPGISIHAFCERNETGSSINMATHDWRMKRANVDIYMGGLTAAIEYYRNETTPNLIVIETGMNGAELFMQLEELASVCDADSKVIIIGASNDIRLYRQLIEKGVSDYLVPPFHPMSFIRSISDLYLSEDVPFIGKSIAVFGSKGGVGSSTIAHNLAWIISEQLGQEISLVDLDESWGTTAIDFAYDTAQGLEEALSQSDRLDEAILDKILIRHTKKLSILPAAASLLDGGSTKNAEAFEKVINGVRGLSPMCILDMPHIWTDWASSSLIAADEIVIVATMDLASLRNTKSLVDFIRQKRPNDKDPLIIANMVGRSQHEIDLREFAAQIGIEPCTILNFDPDMFTEAAIEGKMLTEMKGSEVHVSHLHYLANRLKTGNFQTPATQELAKKASVPSMGAILSKLKKKQ